MSAALLMLNAEKQLIDVSHYDGIKKKETKMAKIVISPYSKPTRQGKVSPKNMPDGRWGEVVRDTDGARSLDPASDNAGDDVAIRAEVFGA